MRLLLTLPLIAALAWLGFAQEPQPEPVAPVTVILVRHAETAGDTSGGGAADPGLSEAGAERAARLAKLFGHAGVTHAYSSEFARTQATVAPLAKAAGVEAVAISARDPKAQLDALRALPAGAVAVVCGHSNTVPALAKELGGAPTRLEEHPRYGGLIPHADYGRIYVMHLPKVSQAKPQMLELNY